MKPWMMTSMRSAAFACAFAIFGCAGSETEALPSADPPEVSALIAGLRSNDPEVRAASASGAAGVGIAALPLLRTKAVVPALPDQVKSVGAAYRSFANAALAPGNEALRANVAAAFLDAIEARDPPLPPMLRDELLAQLGLVANDPASITRLGKLLEDPTIRDAARRALEVISHPAADAVLVAALAEAGTAFKPELARTLGRRRASVAVAPLVTMAASNDPQAAAAARYALARIGDAQSREILLGALDPNRPATFDDLLEFADRRAEVNDFSGAEALYARLLEAGAPHHRAAAAHGLAAVERRLPAPVKENVDRLVAALSDEDASVRVAAEVALTTLDSFGSIALLRQTLWEGEATLRPAILRILDRTDPQREELLITGLHDPSPEVRVEAMRLAARTASDERIGQFVAIAGEESGIERDGAIEAAIEAVEARFDEGRIKDASRWLAPVAATKPTGSAARRLARLAARAQDPAALEWLSDLDAGDEAIRARLALAGILAKRDAGLAQLAVESVYLDAGSRSLRTKALELLAKVGGDPRSALEKSGFLLDWKILGPLPHATDADFETHPFGDLVDLTATFEGKTGPVTWRSIPSKSLDGVVDLESLLDPNEDCSAYGYCEFDSDGGPARVLSGSDDGCAVWLNGKLLYAKNVDRGVNIDEDRADVTLSPGRNSLLIKINQGNGGFGFCVRIVPNPSEDPGAP